ncbi:uncharacterized protein [Clytia hemisphaerica]|uniref:uncharacterized protein isoform X2 n=1 Tax=Clytia hemisphaerica TaxID=252671 RepID=UPI0034D463F1
MVDKNFATAPINQSLTMVDENFATTPSQRKKCADQVITYTEENYIPNKKRKQCADAVARSNYSPMMAAKKLNNSANGSFGFIPLSSPKEKSYHPNECMPPNDLLKSNSGSQPTIPNASKYGDGVNDSKKCQ